MKEKERFELFGEHCIKDNNPDARCQLLNAYVACVILNEQDKRIKELEQENQQLKQQLHDWPKKIVEYFYDEIRHRAILEDDYCPDHNLERKYGVRKCLLEDIRTKILKKYGGEDEN